MDLTDLFMRMSTKQKSKQEIEAASISQDFLLKLLFKELEDSLFLFLIIMMMMPIKLKETITKNIFSKSKYYQLQRTN